MIKKQAIFFASVILLFISVLWLTPIHNPVAVPANDATREAGRYLFYDTRLSFNQTKSCGSCHDPSMAFTDGYRRSVTAGGENLKHNSPSLVNAAFLNYYDWANPSVTSLEQQHERPLFNTDPVELGCRGNEKGILEQLRADKKYRSLFAAAFPGEKDAFDFKHIIRAIASFVGSIRSFNSAYDRYLKGDSAALSLSAKTGRQLFFSDRLKCASCHIPPHFTTASLTRNTDSIYFNTGLYNILNGDLYPGSDRGLVNLTKNSKDDGKFKTPTLRNVGLTAPYMHDGSVNTLQDVIATYEAGGRNIKTGPDKGDGRLNKNKDPRINGFTLKDEERMALLDFLLSLDDSSVLSNPAFQNPFDVKNK